MKKWVACFWLICQINFFFSQQVVPVRWKKALTMPIDSVVAIDASHLKWDTIPSQLYQFVHLTYLDLSKNRLKVLPLELGQLKQLTVFKAEKNKITGAPIVLCQLTQLQKIYLGENDLTTIPDCFGYLNQLKVLDIWDNAIGSLPESFLQLKALKYVDMRGILLTPKFQDQWLKSMPQVTWQFDPPCHCAD